MTNSICDNRLFSFVIENSMEDVDKIVTAGRLYAIEGYKGTCSINLSRRRKYVIDREGDVLKIKENKSGFDVLEVDATNLKLFLRNFKKFCGSTFMDDDMKDTYYDRMAAVAR